MAISAELVVRLLVEDLQHNSHDAVLTDDMVVVSLFASLDPDSASAHVPQVLGREFAVPGGAIAQLYEVFEEVKHKFNIRDARTFQITALAIRNKLVRDRGNPYFRQLPASTLEALKW
jgi:hypothetical protein